MSNVFSHEIYVTRKGGDLNPYIIAVYDSSNSEI